MIVRLTGPLTLCCGFELSVTPIVRFVVPATVGVPLTVHPVSVNPAGNTPAVIVQAYGDVPPVMSIGSLYGVPTTPLGRVGDASVREPGVTIVRLTGPLTLCFGFELSVTLTVRFAVPATVGVPLTVHPLSVKPAGSVPVVTLQLYGDVPPLTPITALYATPTVPFGKLVEVRINDPGVTIVKLSVPLALSFGLELSVTLTVTLETPAVVGVPLTVHPVSVRPAGSVPAVILQAYGAVPPVTSITALYGTPTVPLGRVLNASARPAGLIVSVTEPLVLCCGLELSVTPTVRFEVPAVVGVPLSVQPFSVKPAGSVPPVIVQLYGVVPPVITNVPVYGVPAVPLGRVPDSVNGPPPLPAVMVRDIGPVTLCCGLEASVTFTVRFEIPAIVGVPLTVQPFGASVSPAGSIPPVIVQTYGAVPPATPITWLYGVPTTPFGKLETVSPRDPEETIVRLTGPLTLSCGFELSVTWIVMFDVPAVVGVPLTVQPFIVRPAGSVPTVTVQVYGAVPPVTGTVAE